MSRVRDFMLEENRFKLPVGYLDSEGVVHNIVTLTPITGEVEEKMQQPKIRENSGKVITELLFGIVESLGSIKKVNKEILRDLTTIDRDFLILANAIVSFGKDVEPLKFVHKCPYCKAKNEIEVNLLDLEVNGLEDYQREWTFELKNGIKDSEGKIHKQITVQLPTGRVQERIAPIMTTNTASAITMMLQLITKKLGELPYLTPDTFKKMTKRDRDYISKFLADLNLGVNFEVTTTCYDCGETLETVIPISALLGE
ncbi:MAG: hypothetical protein H0Z24_05920 [Thermosipho sp. (in: Bacteria)]|nr:hypothetical protein [Thermosipho sp. (in: thermotogales)]